MIEFDALLRQKAHSEGALWELYNLPVNTVSVERGLITNIH